ALDREHLVPIDRICVESLRVLLRLDDENFADVFRQTAPVTAIVRTHSSVAHRRANNSRSRAGRTGSRCSTLPCTTSSSTPCRSHNAASSPLVGVSVRKLSPAANERLVPWSWAGLWE